MIGFSLNDLLGVLQRMLNAFKQVLGWFGILVLPNEDEKKYYPGAQEPAQEEDPAQTP